MTYNKVPAIVIALVITVIACNSSSTKEAETKAIVDTTINTQTSPAADPAANQLQVTASFVDFTMGDVPHFNFKDEAGKEWDFRGNNDTTYKFALELHPEKATEANQGWSSNKSLQSKWFNITYKKETQPEYDGGPMVEVLVITSVKPK